MTSTTCLKGKYRLLCLMVVCQLFAVTIRAQFRVKSKDDNSFVTIAGMSFISPSTGYVLYQHEGVGFTQDSGTTFVNQQFTQVNTDFNGYSVNLTYSFKSSGLVALSRDSLLVYGDYGSESSILFSANQGRNWKLVYHRDITDVNQYSGFTVSDMVFPNNGNTGIAVNDKDILRTTDRGQSWTVITQIPETVDSRFTRLSFPSSSVGYAIAGDLLYKTTDGGLSWNQVSLPPGSTGLNFDNVSFVSPSVGYITRKDINTVYKTTTGAASWQQMNNPDQFPVNAADMHFTNDSTGFFITTSSFDVYKTTDNGVSWEVCKSNSGASNQFAGLVRMFFLNKDIAWASGSNIFLMLTTNGGGRTKPAACFSIDLSGLDATSTVLLNSCSKPGYTVKWYLNNVLLSQAYTASYQHNPFKELDTIQLVVSNGVDVDTLTQYQVFSLPPYAPAISSFAPATGSTGTLVTIYGSGFTQVNSVKFGAIKADSFVVINDNIVQAIVAGGATGSITVSDKYSGSSMPGFTYYTRGNAPAPVITNINPQSGPAGTTVLISGSNFNPTPANNIISFGAVNAAVITGSSTALICQVPRGASMEPVSVVNTATALAGRSQKAFTVTFADSGLFTGNSFDLSTQIDYGRDIYVTRYPKYSIGKDIDGDGKPDLVSAINQTEVIALYRNTSVSTFISFDQKNAVNIAAQGVSKFRIEDLDGDGKADIACNSSSGVYVSRNTSQPGKPSLTAMQQVQNATGGSDVAIADLDGDGRNDVATAGGFLQVTRNTSVPGFLSFAVPQTFYSPESTDDLAAADLDGDGKIDLVAHNATMLSCYRNTSTLYNISMATHIDFPLPQGMLSKGRSLAVTDFDLDGKPDVIVFDNRFFGVLRNRSTPGNIVFDNPVTRSLDPYLGDGFGGCVANLCGDNKPDVLTGSLLLFRNNSTPGNIVTADGVNINPGYASSMNTADFDLDGKTDVIATSPDVASTLIYRNKMGDAIALPLCPVVSWDWIDADFTGNSYQWQIDTGNGFTNLVENANFINTTSYSLGLKYLPTSYNGAKLRCRIGSQFSRTFSIAFSFIWIGSKDSNWENAGNWSCGVVPDKYADVIVDQGTVNVNTDVDVRSILVKTGAKVTVTGARKFRVLK